MKKYRCTAKCPYGQPEQCIAFVNELLGEPFDCLRAQNVPEGMWEEAPEIEISEDQNTITENGVEYVAVLAQATPDGCASCSSEGGLTCEMSHHCKGIPCSRGYDGKGVVFLRKGRFCEDIEILASDFAWEKGQ